MSLAEKPDVRVVHTACTLDCPDACSLAVTVTDGRITDIDAGPDNPFTDGWICAKVRRHHERVYAPERVLTPLIRTGAKGAGEFRSATWDEALGLIAGRVQRTMASKGPDGVVAYTYNSSSAVVESDSATEALFAAIGATVVTPTICAHTAGAGWESVFGSMHSAAPADVLHSRLVVIWGANPTTSNTHFPPLVQQAQKNGAKVVVIDPRRTPMAARADLHLPIRPGTDAALAYAIANLWLGHGHLDREFMAAHAEGAEEYLVHARVWSLNLACEVTGLDPDDIQTLARWWGTTKPSMLRIGWGVERNENGGAGFRAVLGLPVLGGHFGVRGSGVIGTVRSRPAVPQRRWPAAALDGPERREVPMHQIGQWMAPNSGDPCEVLFVQGANPVVTCPDTHAVMAAFSRDDIFTVVHEQVLTDTTRYADVVLPATTSFELDDVGVGYGSYAVQPVRAVIAPVGESRSNDQLGWSLAAALGFDWQPSSWLDAVDDPGPRIAVVPSLQFVDTLPFEGRARLVDPVHGLPTWHEVPRPEQCSLVLISPASPKLINSMFGEFQSPTPRLLMHPADAGERGVDDGAPVTVRNDLGSITVPVAVTDEIRPGVVLITKGAWLRHHPEGVGVNALIPATGDSLVNGACFNDTFVEVVRAG
ncbi:MAG: putative dimethyl sulfoxide reductase chain YnfE precursor [Actinomycetota bacterium]|jgi:anaerobic selenocysteine-containing dehydrogenase